MMGNVQKTLPPAATDLNGRRVLVIEDESMVAMLLEDLLTELGCEVVGVASRINEASGKIHSLSFDVAILDVNLRGQQTFAVARALLASGHAIVFATGYAAPTVPPELRNVPILQKPFQRQDLEQALWAALARTDL